MIRGDRRFGRRRRGNESLRIAGAGTLQQQFEEIKSRLAAEGLFDPLRKLPLPAFICSRPNYYCAISFNRASNSGISCMTVS